MTVDQKNIVLGAILGFSLSLITQIVFFIVKYVSKKIKVYKFNNLIYQTYIIQIKNALESHDDKTIVGIKETVPKEIEKLDYLIKGELVFLNADYQFELIRICEFARSKLAKIKKQLGVYSFKGTRASSEDPDIKDNAEKALEILGDYKKDVKLYYSLKSEKT